MFYICIINVPNILNMNLLNRLKFKRLSKLLLVIVLTLSSISYSYSQEIQRVRINFSAPDNSVRQILIAFTPDNSATDDFDFGWDAVNWNSYSNDLSWMVEEYKCTIQGVGAFDINKSYPLHLLLGETGNFNIELHSIENFNEAIDIYIYDSLFDTYHFINDESFNKELEQGEYDNRFFITFTNNLQVALSNSDFEKDQYDIKYIRNTKDLLVSALSDSKIKKVETFTVNGQLLNSYKINNSKSFKTNLHSSTSQILIVRITTDTGITSKKIII